MFFGFVELGLEIVARANQGERVLRAHPRVQTSRVCRNPESDKFLVKELLYVPRIVYRILTKTLSPIKGHDSNEEEVVGIMKNPLFNIIHGVPVNYHDFFMRTLANVALSLFELKPYAPWIMRFLRSMSRPDFRDNNFPENGLCAHQPQDYC